MPDTVITFLGSGGAAAAILALVLAEALALWMRYRRGLGPGPTQWLSQLGAGGALVLSLLLVQREAPPESIGLALLAAGLAHSLGYRQRWIS